MLKLTAECSTVELPGNGLFYIKLREGRKSIWVRLKLLNKKGRTCFRGMSSPFVCLLVDVYKAQRIHPCDGLIWRQVRWTIGVFQFWRFSNCLSCFQECFVQLVLHFLKSYP